MIPSTRPQRFALLALSFLLIALIAAACSDNDFDAAPQDRGALAADRVGAVSAAAQTDADQAADQAASVEQPAAPTPAAPDTQPDSSDAAADAIAVGNQLFFENGCNICHGDTGQGIIGPRIAGTSLTLDQVTTQYRTPREFMPTFPADRVADDQIAQIYAFLQSLE